MSSLLRVAGTVLPAARRPDSQAGGERAVGMLQGGAVLPERRAAAEADGRGGLVLVKIEDAKEGSLVCLPTGERESSSPTRRMTLSALFSQRPTTTPPLPPLPPPP